MQTDKKQYVSLVHMVLKYKIILLKQIKTIPLIMVYLYINIFAMKYYMTMDYAIPLDYMVM